MSKEASKRGRVNRRKGQDLERIVAKDFREIGFVAAATTRADSKVLDDCGIDICNIPFNVQCKMGYEKQRPRFDRLFIDYQKCIEKRIPKGHVLEGVTSNPFILVHKFGKEEHENIVTLKYNDFIAMISDFNKVQ